MLSELAHGIVGFIRDNHQFTEPVVFLVGMAESIPVVSFFVPSSILFIGIGAIHSAIDKPFWHIWLMGSAGACAGDCLIYWIGRHFELRVMHAWPFNRHPGWWENGHAFFERWGIFGVLIGKFMGPLRAAVALAAGVMEMRFVYFLPASIVSSLVWAGVFMVPGMLALGWMVE